MIEQMFLSKGSMETHWDQSFRDQMAGQAQNNAPVEALVRFVSHYLRARYSNPDFYHDLRFLEMGSGTGANLTWLAESGIQANGIDISPLALKICRERFEDKKLKKYLGDLRHGSVTDLPYPDCSFDGVIESCVFQHLAKTDREKAHSEAVRVVKKGGIFVGHMLSRTHTTYRALRKFQQKDDPGTLILENGSSKGKINLETIGLTHFFSKREFKSLLHGCSIIEPCESSYELPREEAKRRGYNNYRHVMWIVYAIK